MIKKPISLILAIAILHSSCAHSVYRSGFDEDRRIDEASSYVYAPCTPKIVKMMDTTQINGQLLGIIDLDDSGFSTRCDELEAIIILKEEACNVGADLVDIIEEKQPDFFSTCYRCTAALYSLDSLNVEEAYTTNLQELNKPKKKNQVLLNVLGFAAGFALGYYLTSLILD